MKCMMSSDGARIVRVSDDEASKLYHNENFKYIAKSVWKEKVRDVEEKEVTPTNKKSNKMSKAQKRNLRKAKKRNSN
jgi:hypothetical protein